MLPKNIYRDRASERGVELGPYPLETLPRDSSRAPTTRLQADRPKPRIRTQPLAVAVDKYSQLFIDCAQTTSAPLGEGSNNLRTRTRELKGAAYYLDAAQVGICEAPEFLWFNEPEPEHGFAIVLLIAFGISIEANNPAAAWTQDSPAAVARMRGLEIGVSIAGHIQALGFAAKCHDPDDPPLCFATASVLAGVTQQQNSILSNPFLGTQFATVVVSTNYTLEVDQPLAAVAQVNPFRHWLGINGAVSGREQNRQRARPSHLSRYPMEQIRRVESPTTLIFEDEVPRVPKRAEFFQRARSGDLGAKSAEEVQRFAIKHPLTQGMMHPLRAMVPHQDGPIAPTLDPTLGNADENTQAIKSLSYHLGADLTGICRIPRYAWYSHGPDGKTIDMQHEYAVVMLVDQGFDTMEGASGDDWISGCQSMRGYIRGAEIAGVMAEFLRGKGISSRPQTNADSQVLHIPLVLLAGLGELSRIGELVLNPYVGPRFKSVVLTTNLPLVADSPIDFGLQEFCGSCQKCARECPVNAIPFGDKVMFNGYEIWKPDVERCTRYRVTNPKGSACGRCMKTCPLNTVVSADGALLHRLGTWAGVNLPALKSWLNPAALYLDKKLGYGKRNPRKRWWQDLEVVQGVAKRPKATNERDLDTATMSTNANARSPVGYYPAADMPAPNASSAVPVNHKAAVARAKDIESPDEAKQRRAKGGPTPPHYIPTKTI